MVKQCPQCKGENPDDALWCRLCNSKLTETLSLRQEPPLVQQPKSKSDVLYQPAQLANQRKKLWIELVVILLPMLLILSAIMVYYNMHARSDFSGISCTINEDFWFDNNTLITSDGWTFSITKVKEYRLEALVLAMKSYSKDDWPYVPINIFSPVDMVLGVDDILEDPDRFPLRITSFRNRYVSWEFLGDPNHDYQYFKTHTGNNHIIPHSKQVLENLSNVSVGDGVLIEGSLVSVYGSRDGERYTWTTDTEIGDFDCEIILVDELLILII